MKSQKKFPGCTGPPNLSFRGLPGRSLSNVVNLPDSGPGASESMITGSGARPWGIACSRRSNSFRKPIHLGHVDRTMAHVALGSLDLVGSRCPGSGLAILREVAHDHP